MIVRFDSSSSGSAQYVGKANGALAVWTFFGAWVGKSRASLESTQPNPTPANLQVRDGFYIANDPAISGNRNPVVIPWDGDVWVLNDGTGPGENISNVVILDLGTPCG